MPVAPAPTAERPLFFGSSMLARTHGVRSHSTGSFQRPKQNPLEPQPCSPSGRLLAPIGSRRPSLPAAQQDDSELALWEGSSHSRGLRGRSRYLAPLSSQCSPDSRLASTCHIDWSGSKRTSDSKCEARTGESIVQWQPKSVFAITASAEDIRTNEAILYEHTTLTQPVSSEARAWFLGLGTTQLAKAGERSCRRSIRDASTY